MPPVWMLYQSLMGSPCQAPLPISSCRSQKILPKNRTCWRSFPTGYKRLNLSTWPTKAPAASIPASSHPTSHSCSSWPGFPHVTPRLLNTRLPHPVSVRQAHSKSSKLGPKVTSSLQPFPISPDPQFPLSKKCYLVALGDAFVISWLWVWPPNCELFKVETVACSSSTWANWIQQSIFSKLSNFPSMKIQNYKTQIIRKLLKDYFMTQYKQKETQTKGTTLCD